MRKKNRSKNKDLLLLLAAVARARKQARKHSTITCPTYPAPTFQVPIPVTSRHVNLRPVSLVTNSSRFLHLTSPHLHPPGPFPPTMPKTAIHPSQLSNSQNPTPPAVHSIPFHSIHSLVRHICSSPTTTPSSTFPSSRVKKNPVAVCRSVVCIEKKRRRKNGARKKKR